MSVWVLGGGGHGAVVIATLRAAGTPIAGVLDDRKDLWKTTVMGVPVHGAISLLDEKPGASVVIGIGDRDVARRLDRHWNDAVQWTTAIHPEATIDETASVAPGAVVFAGAVVQPRTTIGRHAIINTASCVDHDCHIEEFAHLAPGTQLGGGVRVGAGAMVGIGASVSPQCTIGREATVGAGGVVIDDIPSGSTVAGVPARALSSHE